MFRIVGTRSTPVPSAPLLFGRIAINRAVGNVMASQTLDSRQLDLFVHSREVILVGDRGMIGQAAVQALRTYPGLAWITALKSSQIRALVQGEALQLGLFDERNLFELTHPDYPGERLVACRNPELGRARAHKRAALLEATRGELDQVRARVERGNLTGAGKIGVRVGRVLNKYKVAKHFELTIEERRFDYRLLEESVAAEAALDGLYVIRTAVAPQRMDAAEVVRGYKRLTAVERAFRSMKTVDLEIRPIHHRLENRVRAHIFLCMLAYYVEWHMREAWRELLFADEESRCQGRARSAGPRPALGEGITQGFHPSLGRRQPGPQLPHPARRTRLRRAQHLPHAGSPSRCAELPDRYHPKHHSTARLRTPAIHHRVASSTTPGFDLHV